MVCFNQVATSQLCGCGVLNVGIIQSEADGGRGHAAETGHSNHHVTCRFPDVRASYGFRRYRPPVPSHRNLGESVYLLEYSHRFGESFGGSVGPVPQQ